MSVEAWTPSPEARSHARIARHRSRSLAGEIRQQRERTRQRAVQGVCVKCGAPTNAYLCPAHAEQQARYHRTWRGRDRVLKRERYENRWIGDLPSAVHISVGQAEADEWHAFAKAFKMPFSALVRTAMRELIDSAESFEDWRKGTA